jgi:hypothetical protein
MSSSMIVGCFDIIIPVTATGEILVAVHHRGLLDHALRPMADG